MKKLIYLIVLTLILGLVLTGCLLSNVGQVPTTGQSGITYLTKGVLPHDDLVGLWHLDGNSLDSSGNGLGGALSPSGASFVVDGFEQALNVDGTGWVQVPDSLLLEPSEITVEAWVKRLGSPGSCRYIVSKYLPDHHGGYSSYGLYSGGGGGIRFYIGYSGSTSGVILSPAVAPTIIWDGEWHHVAGTFDGSEVKLYFDKVLVGGASTIQDIYYYEGTSDLFIGSYYNGPWLAFSGIIDEVRIWKVALSQDQLGIIYDFGGFLPPVSLGKPFKMGSTIPIKFQLTDVQGVFITNASPSISWELISGGVPSGVVIDGDSSVAANTDSTFRYDPDSNQYIFNLSTKGLTAPATYRITVDLGGGTMQQINIGLK